MNEHFDAVVVGSGFGGSVMAYRLAEAGMRVCLLERGKPYPPGSFPRTPHGMKSNFWDPSDGLYGMYNVWSFKHIETLVSSGLGGGSLIYANVLLRKDEKWFVKEDLAKGGYEYWPITRADLDPHYDRVEKMLNAQRYPFDQHPYDDTPKTKAMQMAAGKLGKEWILPNLAVTFGNPGETPVPGEPIKEKHRNLHDRTRYTCRLTAECDIGCNYGSKNTLDFNYLSEAKRLGAELRCLSEVTDFYPREQGSGYTIRYREHSPGRPRTEQTPRTTITADHLILAAGTLATSYLLLKNKSFFPALSPTLGTHFCGNGDLLTFAVRCQETVEGKRGPRLLDGSLGPVITSAIRVGDAADGEEGRGFYIEDAGYPAFVNWMLEMTDAPGFTRRTKRFVWERIKSAVGINRQTDLSAEIAALMGDCALSSTSVPLLGMGRDVPDGRLSLSDGRLENDWKIKLSDPYFRRLRDTMKQIAGVWDARFRDNATWLLNRRVITVHPLGGAPMGRDVKEGVADSFGEVFNYPGLFVTDGAVMPGPVGPNPALTIAAVSDRSADHIIERHRKKLGGIRIGDTGAGAADGSTAGTPA